MTLTRANIEQVIVSRAGPLMLKAGMAVSYAGGNESLNDAIGWALRQAGYSVADIAAVTDDDVASVSTDNLDTFLDYVEYRTLLSVLTNLTFVDTKVGPRSESLSQLAGQVERRLALLAGVLGIGGVGAMTEGKLYYDFASHGDEGWSE